MARGDGGSRGQQGRRSGGSAPDRRLPWDQDPWEEPRGGGSKPKANSSSRPRPRAGQTRSAPRRPAQQQKRRPTGGGRGGGGGRRVLRSSRRRLARLGSPVRRLNVGMLVVAFVLTLFSGRLVQLQGLDAEELSLQAAKQRIRTNVLYADRGQITDRNGAPLALSADAHDVYVDPTKVPAKPGELSDGTKVPSKTQAAAALAPILGESEDDLNEALASERRFVYLAKQVEPAKYRQALELGIPTLGADPHQKRLYPSGQLAASTLGYVGADGKGLGGIEYSQNDVLAGRNGKQVVEIGRSGQVIPAASDEMREAVPGKNIRLTLDSEIQWAAQRALEAQVKKTDSESGTVIVMDPRTGQLLALATAPGFDPVDLNSAGSAGLGNPAVSDVYEPGSTNKVITAAAALEHTKMRPHTEVTVPSSLRRYDKTFHDDVPHGTWHLTLSGVLAKSSNIGIDLVSEKVGSKQLYRSLRDFGFGERTGIGLPGESRGILPEPENWSGTQRYTIPFGQGVSVNALQMASVYGTIANDGVRVTPSVIAGEVGAGGKFTKAAEPDRKRVVSERTAKQMRRMLEGVTGEHGTAQSAQIQGYRVAGKTGTAQRADPECGCYRGYTASFVGMAPADDPQLVAQVVLQDPKRGHFGGEVAAPVFQDVMSFALQHQQIKPTGTKTPRVKVWSRR